MLFYSYIFTSEMYKFRCSSYVVNINLTKNINIRQDTLGPLNRVRPYHVTSYEQMS